MIFDYETLRLIWWAFLGLLLIGFAVTDGFDLGIAMLLPFIGKNDEERRVLLNSIGPVWEGNQVWFITAGGALFAAWPLVYAVSFSGMYFALFAMLLALIVRPLGFDFRSKLPHRQWRQRWDNALFVSGLVPAFVMGVGVGNLLKGLPFHLDSDMRILYFGDFWGLFSPFTLLTGLLSSAIFLMHGAVYLQLKTEALIQERVKPVVQWAAFSAVLLFAAGGLWMTRMDGYHIISEVFTQTASNPLTKFVKRDAGLWLDNFGHLPKLMYVPGTAFVAALLTVILSKFNRPGWALLTSGLMLAAVILTLGVSMFPFIVPSRISANSSLTIWDASSSHVTLYIMFWVTVIFLPIILAYTTWVFRVLRGKITLDFVRENDHKLY